MKTLFKFLAVAWTSVLVVYLNLFFEVEQLIRDKVYLYIPFQILLLASAVLMAPVFVALGLIDLLITGTQCDVGFAFTLLNPQFPSDQYLALGLGLVFTTLLYVLYTRIYERAKSKKRFWIGVALTHLLSIGVIFVSGMLILSCSEL